MDGTHAELIAVPAEYVHAIPDEISFEEAAAFPLVFATAYRMLVTRAGLREGEWVLVWGVGAGVASAALAIAKALGGRVLVDLDERREAGARAGARRRRGRAHRRATSSPRRGELTGGAGRGHRDRARRRGDVEVVAPGGARRAAGSRCAARRRAQPAREPPPDLLEAAHDPRLDDGHARGFRRGARPGRVAAGRGRSSTACSRWPRRPRRTSTSSAARSSGRSS